MTYLSVLFLFVLLGLAVLGLCAVVSVLEDHRSRDREAKTITHQTRLF